MEFMLKEHKEKYATIAPVLDRMTEKRAGEFAELMEACHTAAKLANNLDTAIDDYCVVKEDELAEGLDAADSQLLIAFLAELERNLESTASHLYDIGRYASMFKNLHIAAAIAQEKKQAEQEEEEEN